MSEPQKTNQNMNLSRLSASRKQCTIRMMTGESIENVVIFAYDTYTVSALEEGRRKGLKSIFRTHLIMKHAIATIEEEIPEELADKLGQPRERK